MEGSTFTQANIQGAPNVTTAGTPGAGLQSGSVAAPTCRVTSLNGEVVTTIQLDLQNLSGSNGAAQVCVGNAEAAADGTSYAYLYQHDNATNGILYKIEMSCIETITGGPANANFVISGSTLGLYEHGQSPAGDAWGAYEAGGNIAIHQTIVDNDVTSSQDAYMYLCNGAAGGGSKGKFTAGKLIMRFYGYKDF